MIDWSPDDNTQSALGIRSCGKNRRGLIPNCTHMHAHTRTHTHTRARTRTHTHTNTCGRTAHAHARTHTRTPHTRTHTRTHITSRWVEGLCPMGTTTREMLFGMKRIDKLIIEHRRGWLSEERKVKIEVERECYERQWKGMDELMRPNDMCEYMHRAISIRNNEGTFSARGTRERTFPSSSSAGFLDWCQHPGTMETGL